MPPPQNVLLSTPAEANFSGLGKDEHPPIQLVRFLATGGLAALVNLTTRYFLTPALGFEVSVIVAYLIGMVTAYVLFRLFVFGHSGRSIVSEAYRFVLVNLLAIVLVWLVSVGLARNLFPAIGLVWHAEDLAHFIGVCVPAASSFVGHRYFTYAKPRDILT